MDICLNCVQKLNCKLSILFSREYLDNFFNKYNIVISEICPCLEEVIIDDGYIINCKYYVNEDLLPE